ncbi:MAG: phosphoethanolamine transferase [Muribaculaceae bacterium]
MGFTDKSNKTRRVLHRLVGVLSAPVVRTPGLFAAMVLMLTAVPWTQYVIVKPGTVPPLAATVQMLSAAMVLVWAVLAVYLLLRLWRRWAACLWLVPVFVALTANWLIDLVLMVVYKSFFNPDIAAVIVSTNPGEATDFISAYGTAEGMYCVFGSLALFIGAYFGMSYLRRRLSAGLRPALRVAAVVMMLAAALCMAFMPESDVTRTNICGKTDAFTGQDFGHGIVPTGVPLVTDADAAPQKIVVIIGESLSRSHCSLYGYGRPTQPRLARLAADSSLVVFSQPTAPALHTIAAFRYIIGTWNGQADHNWYDCPTFLEVARRSGYRLSWISNQSPKGVYDNPVKKIADFCDRLAFTDNGMIGSKGMRIGDDLDSLLIPMAQRWNDGARDLSVIHLLGSHVAYWLRYPPHYGRFRRADYPDLPTDRQRIVLSSYDNTVLYNDMVVSRLMRLYDRQDAVVIYFSDHAQDLFESDRHFFGHGRDGVPASESAAAAIPMMVYMTPAFRRRHPDTEALIRRASARPFNTTDLTALLMQIMHTEFALAAPEERG